MSLSQRLEGVSQDVERARSLAVGSATPQWRGLAAKRFDERRSELALLLIRLGTAVHAAQAVTAQFERAWWDEAAQRTAAGSPGLGAPTVGMR